jgi:hypothetical protein
MPTKILNSVNNALRGVTGPVNSLVGGTIAQPSLGIVGANIPFQPLISFRDTFLNSMSQWTNAIPRQTQFIVLFDNFPPGLNTSVLQRLEPNVFSTGFDINVPKTLLTSIKNQSIIGCVFVNAFNFGGESLGAAAAKIDNNRGFIQGTVLTDRGSFAENKLMINFRETNTSFTDLIMRPWLIMASHYGYVARNPADSAEVLKNPKVNMTIVQYSPTKAGLSQIPRKTWRFFNCVPISLDNRTNGYDAEKVDNYSVNFIYDKYEVQSNLYLSVEQLIKSINPLFF